MARQPKSSAITSLQTATTSTVQVRENNSEAEKVAGAAPANQGAATAGQAASDPSASGKSVAEGTNSTDNRESEQLGGAGSNAAGPAGVKVAVIGDAVIASLVQAPDMPRDRDGAGNLIFPKQSAVADAAPEMLQAPEVILAERDKIRAEYPLLAVAFEAYLADHGGSPTGLRITSKVDGFRRAGIAHPKATVDHPMEAFPTPHLIEQLLGERNLVVELI